MSDDPILFDSAHGFAPGDRIAFDSGGERQTATVIDLENNLNHLWLMVGNPDGFTARSLRNFKRHCIDARRVTEHETPPPAPAPVIRQRTRVRPT